MVVVGLVVYLLIRNEPISDPRLFFALRVILSLSAATLGATIPGFLNVGWTGAGWKVRAGGALALFVLTFMYTPSVVFESSTITQITKGPLSPAIGNNNAPLIIQGEPQRAQ